MTKSIPFSEIEPYRESFEEQRLTFADYLAKDAITLATCETFRMLSNLFGNTPTRSLVLEYLNPQVTPLPVYPSLCLCAVGMQKAKEMNFTSANFLGRNTDFLFEDFEKAAKEADLENTLNLECVGKKAKEQGATDNFHINFIAADHLKTSKMGNCGPIAAYFFFYFYAIGPHIKLHIIETENDDHGVVLVNTAWDSEIEDRSTWGEGAAVFDGWFPAYYPATHIPAKFKAYRPTQWLGVPEAIDFDPAYHKFQQITTNFFSVAEFEKGLRENEYVPDDIGTLTKSLRSFHEAPQLSQKFEIAKEMITLLIEEDFCELNCGRHLLSQMKHFILRTRENSVF